MSVNNRQLLIAKAGVNYGASKTDSTAETATEPNDLADGALGIFYRNANSGWSLVTSGAPGTKSLTTMPDILLVQGTADGYVPVSIMIEGMGLEFYGGKSYDAPVKEVVYIAYDSSSSTGDGIQVENSKDYNIGIFMRGFQSLPYVPTNESSIRSKASGNTAYSIAMQSMKDINNKLPHSKFNVGFPYLAEISADGTSAAVTASTTGSAVVVDVAAGTPTVTGSIASGSKTLTLSLSASTFSGTQVIAVGDYIKVNGGLYKIAAQDFTTDTAKYVITLDNEYVGTTLTAAAAANFVLYSVVPTKFGIKLTADNFGVYSEFSVSGALEGTLISYAVRPKPGSGTYSEVLDAEQKAQHYRGYFHPKQGSPETPPTFSVAGETYDLITITHASLRQDGTNFTSIIGFTQHTQIAIPASLTGGGNFLTYLNAWALTTPRRLANVSV